jgi:hypothetical protein
MSWHVRFVPGADIARCSFAERVSARGVKEDQFVTVGLAGFRSQADDAPVNKARELGWIRVMRGGVGFSRRLFCQAWPESL